VNLRELRGEKFSDMLPTAFEPEVGIKISPVIKMVFQHYLSEEKYVFLNNFDISSFIIKALYAIKIFYDGSFGS